MTTGAHTLLRLLACCLLCLGGLGNASASEVFEFWPGQGVESAAGFQSLDDHPCGKVAYAKVSRLPTAKKGPLISEIAVELNAQGKVTRRWPMPVDYAPHAIRGDELLVVAGRDRGFWVRSNGAFRRAAAIPEADARAHSKCDLASVFGESDYAGCTTFVDLASHKERTIGYQGVCT